MGVQVLRIMVYYIRVISKKYNDCRAVFKWNIEENIAYNVYESRKSVWASSVNMIDTIEFPELNEALIIDIILEEDMFLEAL